MIQDPKHAGFRERLAQQKVPIGVVAIGAIFVIGGLDLGYPAGRFPVMLGAVAAALAVLEIVENVFFSTKPPKIWMGPLLDGKEIVGIAWILATIALIFAAGILLGAFMSGLIFTKFVERRTIKKSILISAGIVFTMWFAFSYLAKFEMYSGRLF